MKIEDQVCSLAQAKRINELGIKQGLSIFFYDECREGLVYNNSPTGGYFNAESCFSAFTVAELGEMLPTHITWEDDQYFFQIIRGSKRWLAEWHTNKKDLAILSDGELDRPRGVLWNTYKGNKYLVNILADWVIALLEHKIITSDFVNKQL